MLLLEGVALTPSGRPVLAPEELELRILEKTDVEFGPARGGLRESPAEKYTGGIAFLTSHRLIWLDAAALPSPGRSCSLQLARAMVASAVPLKMFGSRTRRHRIACRRGVLAPDDPGARCASRSEGKLPTPSRERSTKPSRDARGSPTPNPATRALHPHPLETRAGSRRAPDQARARRRRRRRRREHPPAARV